MKNKCLKIFLLSAISFLCASCNIFNSSSNNRSSTNNSSSDVVGNKLVTSISFSLSSDTILKGETCTISLDSVLPEDAENKEVVFSLSDTTIASISGNVITGLKNGSTLVIASATDGSEVVSKKLLFVTDIKVAAISLTLDRTVLNIGESTTATVNIEPANAFNKSYHLETKNTGIVSFDGNKITALKSGTAYVRAYADDGGNAYSDAVAIKVTDIKTTGITLNCDKNEIFVGETANLSISVAPSNSIDNEVTYSTLSGTSAIVSVSNNGVVSGKGVGEETIIATLKSNSSITSSFKIKVKKIAVSSISASANKNELLVGESTSISYSILPSNATNKKVGFKTLSGKNDVLEILENGVVKGVKAGSETIVVYSLDNEEIKFELVFNVINVPATSITVTARTTTLYLDESLTLNVEVGPSNAFDKAVSFKTQSGTNNVLTVSASGIVYSVASGVEVVEVFLTSNPTIKTSIEITVLNQSNPNDPFKDDDFNNV